MVMIGKEAVARVMKLRGMSAPVLAKKLKYATASGVTERLYAKQDIRVDTLVKFLEALDCEVVIKSTLADKTVLVIDGKPEPKENEKK